MSKKIDSSLLQEDLYEILGLSIDDDEKQIKKSFRKKALDCHPDKNPDNPDAADQFDRLKKILEILLDPGARRAYDKVLKARKEAAIRSRETDAKTRKLKCELAEREKAAQRKQETGSHLSEEEKLRREIKRLEEEGEQLIAEELEKLNKEAKSSLNKDKNISHSHQSAENRVKVKWKESEEHSGYTQEELEKLFYKNLASQFEKGLIGKPIEVTKVVERRRDDKKEDTGRSSRDFETVAQMNQRREIERQKLIEEMLRSENS
ncbi:DnaJ-like protein subfamily C member 17 [Armadillidium nasatum]|uniref:DnaJ-like protein subfamily C member 17 n=1 Tax=Armadillidium nasatum TaxID=96803 RepID=A0A5N5TKQ4_9CRUS|nr:DnaJ-like protein subfamily C member 17 [Armadillidium nasatum]